MSRKTRNMILVCSSQYSQRNNELVDESIILVVTGVFVQHSLKLAVDINDALGLIW